MHDASSHQPNTGSTEPTAEAAGDFVHCYTVHYARLVRALELAGADSRLAEDVAQESFARALARWSKVQKGDNPAGYVYRSAFRLLFKKAKNTFPIARDPNASVPWFESHSALSLTVGRVVGAMPPKRRSCAVLCLVLGFEVSETADLLGIASSTVRKHLEKAKDELRSAIVD